MQLFIGRTGVSSGLGVLAKEDIMVGEEVAVIPRAALLTANTSVAGAAMRRDKKLLSQLTGESSWVPLLLAIIAEYSQVGVF